MSMDHTDEKAYAKSNDSYHINKSLIKSTHTIDPVLAQKIAVNPNVMNAKAPKVQAGYWGIYDVNKKESIYGKSMDTRREVASVTKIATAYAVIELARKYDLDL